MEFTLTLTQDDMKVLELALIEAPWKLSNPLINKINQQTKTQLQVKDE